MAQSWVVENVKIPSFWDIWNVLCMEELSVYMTGARELDGSLSETLLCVWGSKEGAKKKEKKKKQEWGRQKSDSRQKKKAEKMEKGRGAKWGSGKRGVEVKDKWLEGLKDGERGE